MAVAEPASTGAGPSVSGKMGCVLDRFVLFQGAMAEFLYLLYLPFEQSLRFMQEKLEELVDFVRQRHRLAKINLTGTCVGGTFAVM